MENYKNYRKLNTYIIFLNEAIAMPPPPRKKKVFDLLGQRILGGKNFISLQLFYKGKLIVIEE